MQLCATVKAGYVHSCQAMGKGFSSWEAVGHNSAENSRIKGGGTAWGCGKPHRIYTLGFRHAGQFCLFSSPKQCHAVYAAIYTCANSACSVCTLHTAVNVTFGLFWNLTASHLVPPVAPSAPELYRWEAPQTKTDQLRSCGLHQPSYCAVAQKLQLSFRVLSPI